MSGTAGNPHPEDSPEHSVWLDGWASFHAGCLMTHYQGDDRPVWVAGFEYAMAAPKYASADLDDPEEIGIWP